MHTRYITIIVSTLLAAVCASGSAAAQDRSKAKDGLKLTTVVIDPGHGGKDAGCISRDGKTKEKTIVLDIGKRLRDKIKDEIPGLKVIMTRSDDRFIELQERAAIANRNNAGLFISIHVNAVDTKKNRNWRNVKGFSIHTLGQSRTGRDLYSLNMDLCKRENSVILLEDDYSAKYQGFDPNDTESYIFFNLLQNANLNQSLHFAEGIDRQLKKGGPFTNSRGIHQDPFLVLWKTTMPAVLVECGYITSESDLAALTTEKGRDKIAEGLLNALKAYKRDYDMGVADTVEGTVDSAETEDDAEAAAPSEENGEVTVVEETSGVAPEGVVYGTQILASGKEMSPSDKYFKGYRIMAVKSGKLWKYIAGTSTDRAQARQKNKKVKAAFPDSFTVKVENGEVSRVNL